MRAIGLMSGTSMDGIDAALVETDGEDELLCGPSIGLGYGSEERALLREAALVARSLGGREERPGIMAEAEAMVTRRHAEAVRALMAEVSLDPGSVDLIGFHGQTVLHRPDRAFTVQLGDGPALAAMLAIPVVHDFRAADMKAGGEGAPFVPAYHRALVRAAGLDLPVAVLNIGGVANVTLVEEDDLLAFDTGPGNALIDDWIGRRTGATMDVDGALALAGRVDGAALARLLDHPFFAVTPPKSLDRDDFEPDLAEGMSSEDGAATLTAFTAASVASSRAHMKRQPKVWIVAGGGARNPALMAALGQHLAPARVTTAEALGWSGDHLEAQAFAYLAVRSMRGLPLSFPGTTGVPAPMSGGVLARP